jgi:hypothetical protein
MLSPHIHAALPHERCETVLVTQPSERPAPKASAASPHWGGRTRTGARHEQRNRRQHD